jgi:hypothetical protein
VTTSRPGRDEFRRRSKRKGTGLKTRHYSRSEERFHRAKKARWGGGSHIGRRSSAGAAGKKKPPCSVRSRRSVRDAKYANDGVAGVSKGMKGGEFAIRREPEMCILNVYTL